jgi:hypothetical protein
MEDFLGFRTHLYDVFQYRVINYVLIINYVTYTVCPYTYKMLITLCPLYKPPKLFFFSLFRNISHFDSCAFQHLIVVSGTKSGSPCI